MACYSVSAPPSRLSTGLFRNLAWCDQRDLRVLRVPKPNTALSETLEWRFAAVLFLSPRRFRRRAHSLIARGALCPDANANAGLNLFCAARASFASGATGTLSAGNRDAIARQEE